MLKTILSVIFLTSVRGLNLYFNSNFDQCIVNFANNHLNDRTVVIVNSATTLDFKYLVQPKLEFDSSRFDTLNSINVNNNNYILIYQGLEHLNETLAELKSRRKSWHSRGKFLVTTTDGGDVQGIIKLLWDYNVYNSLVAVRNGSDAYFYGYNYVNSQCGKAIVTEKVAICLKGVVQKIGEIYEKKITNNLCNNTFTVLWCYAPPFAIDDRRDKNPGILLTLMKLFAERSNLNVQFVENTSRYIQELEYQEDRPIISEDLDNNVGDIFVSLSGLDYRKFSLYECTVPAHYEVIYWIIPKPLKNPFWKSITTPFTLPTWLALTLIGLLLPAVIFWLTSHQQDEHQAHRQLQRSAMLAFRLALSESDNLLPKTTSFRTCFVFFSIAGLIIDTYYQCKLFLFLSDPGYQKEISTLDDILDSGLPLMFQEGFGYMFLMTGPKNQEVFDRFIAANIPTDDILYNAAKNRSYITIINGGQVTVNPHLRNSFNTLQVIFLYIVLLMKRDHVLMEHLNGALRRIGESGFYEKWVSDVEIEYFKRPMEGEVQGVFKLTVNHLQGAFIILGIGYMAAIMSFVLEMVHVRIRRSCTNRRLFKLR